MKKHMPCSSSNHRRRALATSLPLALGASLLSFCGHGHHGAKGVHDEHRFQNADQWAKVFEDPRRDAWQRPDALIRTLDLDPAARVADIGSATGYLTVRLARAVPRGRVYGFDLQPDMVRYLAERAQREKLPQLTSLKARRDGIDVPEPLDLVFTCNTYHHLEDRVAYFRRIASQLKPSGRVAVVDFKPGPLPVGPPERHRVRLEMLDRELTAAGFVKVSHDLSTLPHQYIAMYRKAP